MWQQSYFYVKSVHPEGDWVNLLAYAASPPTGACANWSYRPKTLLVDGAAAVAHLMVMVKSEGLTGPDLLTAFVARRVLLLQGRPHMICQMSGHQETSRMCTKEMPHSEVAHLVNYI